MTEPSPPRDRQMAMRTGIPAQVLALLGSWLLALLLAACSTAAASPTPEPTPLPTERPTPTPVGGPVSNAREAAALIIAANPLLTGAVEVNPDLIGQSRWWTASPLAGGGYTIEVTVGWGDCPAGCINRHVWTYEVTPDGAISLVSETGDEVPAVLGE